jgi:hypothetical protein
MNVRVGLPTVLLFEQTISARRFQSSGLPASIHYEMQEQIEPSLSCRAGLFSLVSAVMEKVAFS